MAGEIKNLAWRLADSRVSARLVRGFTVIVGCSVNDAGCKTLVNTGFLENMLLVL